MNKDECKHKRIVTGTLYDYCRDCGKITGGNIPAIKKPDLPPVKESPALEKRLSAV